MDRFTWRYLGDRPLLFPALFLALGAGLSIITHFEVGVFLLPLAACLACGLWLTPRPGAHLCLLGSLLFGGAVLSTLEAGGEVPPVVSSTVQQRVEGEVADVQELPNGTALTLSVTRVWGTGPQPARFRARLYGNGPLPVLPGQRILVATRLKPIEPPKNPGEPDRQRALAQRKILFRGSFDPQRVTFLSPPSRMAYWIDRERQLLVRSARAVAPSEEAAALYLTLAAGTRGDLGENLEEQFAESGLAHVLSVSGLHVGVLALTLFAALRALGVRLGVQARTIDVRRWAALGAIPISWAYVVFTGSQLPAIRSAVMITLVFLGKAFWRHADAMNGLALAALLLVSFAPWTVCDLSAQLSFLAVTSLLLLQPAIRNTLPIPRPTPSASRRAWYVVLRAAEWSLSTFCASTAVCLATLPLLATAFHRASVVGIVSNVVCLPISGLLTLLAATGAAAHLVSPVLAKPLLWSGAWLSEALVASVRLFSQWPGGSILLPAPPLWATAAYYGGLLFFALGTGKARLFAWLLPAGLAAFLLPLWGRPEGLRVTFLSVGHGDAIVMSSAGKHALVDGGGVPDGADTGTKFVIPFLRERAISELELAALSHPHPDHALGLISTLGRIRTRRLWMAAGTQGGELTWQLEQAAKDVAIERVEAGHPPLSLGNATIEVLGPPRDRVLLEGVNDRSLVLRVRYGGVSFLLPGDIEQAGEEATPFPEVTVLKAPHHGSPTSSTADFVRATRPRYVVFCVGENNRFHFPDKDVVERYEAVGSKCFRTDLDGAVQFETDGTKVWTTPFRRRPLFEDQPAKPRKVVEVSEEQRRKRLAFDLAPVEML